jgi:hypothetical protein
MDQNKNQQPAQTFTQPNQTERIPSNIMIKSSYYMNQSKPANYISETISEIYYYIMKINPSEYNQIEIEAKLGTFDFKGSCLHGFKDIKDTFKLPLYNKSDRNYNYFKYDFKPGLDEDTFMTMLYLVKEESKRKGSDILPIEPIYYKEIHYQSGIRKSTIYKNGTKVSEELILKKKKHHINIRNFGKDFRISSCLEEKQSKVDFNDVPTLFRDKFRISYKFRYFRMDFTIVTQGGEQEYSSNKEAIYEVEFEFEELHNFLKNEFKNFDDFQKMFLRFIQNIFCIFELINPESIDSHIKSMKNSHKDNSIFGNYFEKTLFS